MNWWTARINATFKCNNLGICSGLYSEISEGGRGLNARVQSRPTQTFLKNEIKYTDMELMC